MSVAVKHLSARGRSENIKSMGGASNNNKDKKGKPWKLNMHEPENSASQLTKNSFMVSKREL